MLCMMMMISLRNNPTIWGGSMNDISRKDIGKSMMM